MLPNVMELLTIGTVSKDVKDSHYQCVSFLCSLDFYFPVNSWP